LKTYSDLSGDGGSQVIDQVIALKETITQRLAGIKRILTVGSAKGGVGKSTLCMQLGLEMNRRFGAVALLDGDLNGPSLARLAGLRDATIVPGPQGLIVPKTEAGLGVLSLGSLIPETQNLDFDNVAPGESQIWRATREFTLLSDFLARTHWGGFECTGSRFTTRR